MTRKIEGFQVVQNVLRFIPHARRVHVGVRSNDLIARRFNKKPWKKNGTNKKDLLGMVRADLFTVILSSGKLTLCELEATAHFVQ